MAIYTVHVPDDASDRVTEADRTVFVREGFSARAFVFGILYLLWHRLWSAAVLWIAAAMALAGFALVLHPPAACTVALAGLMHLYLGAEGPDLLRWGLGRRGYTMRDLVSASNLNEAEAVYFGRQPARAAPPARPVPRWTAPGSTPAVIGMFPDGSGS